MALFRKSKFMSAARALTGRGLPRRGPPRRFRPRLEGLEERAVPATLTWDPVQDDGTGKYQFGEKRNWAGQTAAPAAGDSVVFDGSKAHHQDCTWGAVADPSTLDTVTFFNGFAHAFVLNGNYLLTVTTLSMADTGAGNDSDAIRTLTGAELKVTGNADISRGILGLIAGQTTNTGAPNFQLGPDTGTGTASLLVPSTKTFTFDGGYVRAVRETVTQSGPGTGYGGNLKFNRGAVLQIDANSVWNAAATGSTSWDMIDWASDKNNAYVNVLGTLNVTGAASGVVRFGVPLQDGGVVNVTDALMQTQGGVTATAGYSYYKYGGGTSVVDASSALKCWSGFDLIGGTVEDQGTLDGEVTSKVAGATLKLFGGGGAGVGVLSDANAAGVEIDLTSGSVIFTGTGNKVITQKFKQTGGAVYLGAPGGAFAATVEFLHEYALGGGTLNVYETWASNASNVVTVDGNLTYTAGNFVIIFPTTAGPNALGNPAQHWTPLHVGGTQTGAMLMGWNPTTWNNGGSLYSAGGSWAWSGAPTKTGDLTLTWTSVFAHMGPGG